MLIVAMASSLVSGYVSGKASGYDVGVEAGKAMVPSVEIKCDCKDEFQRTGVKCGPGCRCVEGVKKPAEASQ